MIAVRKYIDETGRNPFGTWFADLESAAAIGVAVALERIAQGHRSAMKASAKGVLEYKVDFGRVIEFSGWMATARHPWRRRHEEAAGQGHRAAKLVWKDYKRRKRAGGK